jgi:4-hydroxy-4-methyl-2-oxoglutarate aldolase
MVTTDMADRLRRLHPALICDVLDGLGFRRSALGLQVQPVRPDMVVAGRAFTMKWESVAEPPEKPYERLLAAYRHLEEGDVIVMQSADDTSAIWGELLSTAAVVKGVTGAVMDGPARDIAQIIDMGFPVFATGVTPLDSAGRQEVVEYQTTIQCGDATVHPGDWIFGDLQGAAVIPAGLLDEAVALAESKDAGESTVRDDLLRGDDIKEVFDRYGIL